MENFGQKIKSYSYIYGRIILYGILGIFVILFLIYSFFFQPNRNFKPDSTVRIESGQSLIGIARSLQNSGIISSPRLLTDIVVFFGGEHKVVAGYYLFHNYQNLLTIAYRLTHGEFDIKPIKITIPEGLNSREITDLYAAKFNLFASSTFYDLAKPKEGYLFPETYFFVPTVLPQDVAAEMESTFIQMTDPLKNSVVSSGHTLNDIVTMASILEGEATSTADREIIAGILWKRISLGIPLQVDSSLKYITGKTSAELTKADLEIDSPYNTYNRRGLPPTPISNPGLNSIEAALNPTTTGYLYFLSDKNGNIHYAETFKEHQANIKKYL